MKDLQISKKLINEVLKIPLDVINEVYFDKTHLLVRKTNNRIEEHNIYEFAFKCKKWLLKNNIAFTLNYYNDNSVQFYCEKYHLDIESFSEIETIIKACEWILKNEKNPK